MTVTAPWTLTTIIDAALDGDPQHALDRWALSGAMHLTGAADGPPLAGSARAALAMDALAQVVEQVSAQLGTTVSVDGAALLGERAALAGFSRQGSISCGGGSRLLTTADDVIALSLTRRSDIELLGAWLDEAFDIDPRHDEQATPMDPVAWASLAALVRQRPSRALVDRAALLGLPCARLGEASVQTPLVSVASLEQSVRAARSFDGLTVVDLSSLWAGPLCANLLSLAGARVVKVESRSRPDGTRLGPSDFFDLLHAGHRSVALDFATDLGLQWLRRLLASADVVIESSRPRALHALGASFDHMRTDGWRGVWLSITAHGRDDEHGMRVGFGDDSAVAGGLLAHHDGAPVFCADAVADPLTGLLGAATVMTALHARTNGLHAISLARTAAQVAAGIRRHPAIDLAPVTVVQPRARTPASRAAALGADTDEVLSAL